MCKKIFYFLTSQEEHGSILLPILCDLYRQYPQINFFSKKYSRDLILKQLVNQEASIGFLFRHLVEDQLINFRQIFKKTRRKFN